MILRPIPIRYNPEDDDLAYEGEELFGVDEELSWLGLEEESDYGNDED